MNTARTIAALIFFSSVLCAGKPRLKEGWYRGELLIDPQAGVILPFNFEVKTLKKSAQLVIYNADERIVVDELSKRDDSLLWKMPAFDTEFRTRITASGLEGVWINHYRSANNVIPFRASWGDKRRFMPQENGAFSNMQGKWEVTFGSNEKDSSKAIGLFSHVEASSTLYGTFRTETGDYRYLEGIAAGNAMMLSTFNGSSAYLFMARLDADGHLSGDFWSGTHFHQRWTARRNPDFELRDPDAITTFDNSKPLRFRFPDHKGARFSLTDTTFMNKPVIIQLMGTWCANCMDESRYLQELYAAYYGQGLRIVGLAYEKTPSPDKIPALIERYIERLKINYPILLTSTNGKQKASETFPLLSKVSAFPTTIFLDRDHRIVRVHTGFNGPATGQAYQDFRQQTESLIRQLLLK